MQRQCRWVRRQQGSLLILLPITFCLFILGVLQQAPERLHQEDQKPIKAWPKHELSASLPSQYRWQVGVHLLKTKKEILQCILVFINFASMIVGKIRYKIYFFVLLILRQGTKYWLKYPTSLKILQYWRLCGYLRTNLRIGCAVSVESRSSGQRCIFLL